MSTQVRQHGHATAVNPGGGGHGNNVPGRINMAEYTMVKDEMFETLRFGFVLEESQSL